VLRAGVGLSAERDSTRAAVEAATIALRSAGAPRADACLVFATTAHGPGWGAVLRAVAETCGTRDLAGCSAAGVLAGEEEIERGPGVAVLALAGVPPVRRFMVPVSRGRADDAAEAVAGTVADAAVAGALVLLFADCHHLAAEPFFAALAARVPGLRVAGGAASEDGSVGEVAVFAGDTAAAAAVSGLVFGPDVQATIGVAQALRRVGAVHRVTEAEGHLVVSLDGRPALDAFRAIVPEPLLADPRRALAVVLAGVVTGEDGFVARHLVGFDAERGALALAAPVSAGDRVFFGVRDAHGAREELDRVAREQALAWGAQPPAGGLYVSCIGRGQRFFGVHGLETAYLRQHLGALPVVGFASGAEFAPGGGIVRVHQYTGVLTLLGER
jgi:small ligand-binding sensory domain FIST